MSLYLTFWNNLVRLIDTKNNFMPDSFSDLLGSFQKVAFINHFRVVPPSKTREVLSFLMHVQSSILNWKICISENDLCIEYPAISLKPNEKETLHCAQHIFGRWCNRKIRSLHVYTVSRSFRTCHLKQCFCTKAAFLQSPSAFSETVVHFIISTPRLRYTTEFLVRRIYRPCQIHIIKNTYSWLTLLPLKSVPEHNRTFEAHRTPPSYITLQTCAKLTLWIPEIPKPSLANTLWTLLLQCTGRLINPLTNAASQTFDILYISHQESGLHEYKPHFGIRNIFTHFSSHSAHKNQKTFCCVHFENINQVRTKAVFQATARNQISDPCNFIHFDCDPISYDIGPAFFNSFQSLIIPYKFSLLLLFSSILTLSCTFTLLLLWFSSFLCVSFA